MGVQIPHGKGQFLGKEVPIVKYRDTLRSRAKTGEPIEMPFGLWPRNGLRKHELDGVQIPREKGQFSGERVAHCKV